MKRFFAPLKKHPGKYVRALINYSMRSVFPIFSIVMIELLTQSIERGSYEQFKFLLVAFAVGVLGLQMCSFVIRDRGWVTLQSSMLIDLYDDIIRKFLRSSNTEVEKIGTGKIIAIVQGGIKTWQRSLSNAFYYIPRLLISLGYTGYLLMRTGWWMVGVFLAIIAIMYSLVAYLNEKVVVKRNKSRDIDNERTRKFVKIIMSKFEILQNNKVDHELQNLIDNTMEKYENDKSRSAEVDLIFRLPDTSMLIVKILVFGLVGYGVLGGSASFSDLVVFAGALTLIDRVVKEFVKFFFDITRDFSVIEKLRTTMDALPVLSEDANKPVFVYEKGDIVLKNVCFGYEDTQIFSELTVKITGGKKTAFVGHSGGGKTTLMKLIAGYVTPDSGKLLVDGQNIVDASLQSYYKHIGYLTQDPSVFDGSIRDNLLYSLEKEPKEKDLKRILSLAKCEFIYGYKDGLDTEIGERGVRLSGGQKQRLAIAKIMLKDPEIILLDEPTSALDSVSEQKVSDALHALFEGRTVIVVAHRLQTVKEADEILVFDKGKIVQRGSHAQLESKDGIYQDMLRLQTTF